MAATPALSTASQLAEAAGKIHCKIFSTTPSNIDTPTGAFCKSIIDGACTFFEGMYDWSRKHILECFPIILLITSYTLNILGNS